MIAIDFFGYRFLSIDHSGSSVSVLTGFDCTNIFKIEIYAHNYHYFRNKNFTLYDSYQYRFRLRPPLKHCPWMFLYHNVRIERVVNPIGVV